ncbi:hypothetical protein PLESTF_001414200 [Pleodorina starrii]|nr:hypothetical protein PLESTF_001414200 [Pleodorina starrii]
MQTEAKGAHSVLDEVAQARLRRIKSQLEATGELPVEAPRSAAWTAVRYVWNALMLGTAGFGAAATYYTYAYSSQELTDVLKRTRAEVKEDQPLSKAWCDVMERYLTFRKNMEERIKEYTDPATDKLLPDLHPQLRGNVITLVLDLDELLVFKEWTRQKGWSIYKRPGVAEFLLDLGQYFEIVVYTDEPATYADPILNKLDPHRGWELTDVLKRTRAEVKEDQPLSKAWCDVMERYLTFRKNMEERIKEYTDPATDKLLPDLHPQLRGNVITLVLDLDELLVFKEWTRQKGWSIYKRPGVAEFLLDLGQYFEIVVYTDEPATYADPILNKLDPHRVVPFRLYRTDTQYKDGRHVRDLSKLNRDLTHVLMISAKPEAWEFQPENTLKLRPWKGEAGDTGLIDLIPFLQFLATRRVRDVRDVVKSYDGVEDVPAAFKARLQEATVHQKQQTKRGFLGPAR